MRLVDADALQAHFDDMRHYEPCACNFEYNGNNATQWYCVEDAVENAPTIDAIMVEWLNERHRRCCEEADTDLMDAITVLCNEYHVWQKEQEAR